MQVMVVQLQLCSQILSVDSSDGHNQIFMRKNLINHFDLASIEVIYQKITQNNILSEGLKVRFGS